MLTGVYHINLFTWILRDAYVTIRLQSEWL